MRQHLLPVVLTAAVLVVGLDVATYATTGNSLILGSLNTSGRATTLQRTTTGPAIKLVVKPGQPPLAVTTGVKVDLLNADRVDGLNGPSLQTDAITETVPPGTTNQSSELFDLGLAPGRYSVGWSAEVGAATSKVVMLCGMTDPAFTRLAGSSQAEASALFASTFLSGSTTVMVTKSQPAVFFCQAGGGAFRFTDAVGGTHVTAIRLDHETTRTPATVPAPARLGR